MKANRQEKLKNREKPEREKKQKQKKKKERPKKERRVNTWLVTLGSLTFVVVAGLAAWVQLQKYERGVMDVYAIQQDGYVQLVLDQINLVEDRDDEEIVTNILATLDASSNRYWTFSNQEALIFVKDVMETNRYKGFTTETYYGSATAREFIEGLRDNRVTHDTIQIGDRQFIASGVRYEYNHQQYCICLLTNADVVLDHNAYLSAKINLSVLAIAVLAVIVVIGIILAGIAEGWYKKYASVLKTNKELREGIERLNEALNRDNLFNTQHMAFEANALPVLLEKLELRNVWPLEMIVLHCEGEGRQEQFLLQSQTIFDQRTMRVILDDSDVLLLVLKSPMLDERELGELMGGLGAELCGRTVLEDAPLDYLESYFAKFYRQVKKHG